MRCPKCQHDNPVGSDFCGMCATPLPRIEEMPTVSHTKIPQTPLHDLTRGSTFATRYEVIEELGSGGMGKVYRVFDKQIEEEVALKLIRLEIASHEKTIERFKNELKITRHIGHKNVCKMYDLNEDKGTHYLTMEYVPGEDLKSMIAMMGRLSAGQVVSITKQVCEGLDEAHRLGIVHRDLKSSNIIVDRKGNAHIMDFGIARSLKSKGITSPGAMVGTSGYMPPEQVEAKKVDQRADVYSLGVIIYEMVTGRMPFDGENSLSIAFKQKTESPPDPRQFNSSIPEGLCHLILKCMEKDREKRYQSANEVLTELRKLEEEISTAERILPKRRFTPATEIGVKLWKRWMTITALFLVAAVAGFGILYSINKKTALPMGRQMLVVMPFENLGPPEDEYFADGITEEITSRLSALQGLGVISRTSAIKYKNTQKSIKQIGEELGVDYILEGTVRWERNSEGKGRVRVTPQLVQIANNTHIWSERYDRVIEDLFSVQSEIAEQVARKLDLTVLAPERAAMYAKPTGNLEAYDFYLQGLKHDNRGWLFSDAGEIEIAVKKLEKAIELDPEFALAYAKLSIIHSKVYFFGIDRTQQRLVRARCAVDRALELQSDLPDARMSLAFYYYWGLLDYDRAVEIFETVQKAHPNLSPELLGYVKRRKGQWEESLEILEEAFKLNPRYSQLAYEIGITYLGLHRYEKAKEWFDLTLSLNPKRITPQLGKIAIYVLSRGDLKTAQALLETLPKHRLTDYMSYTLGMLDRDYEEVLSNLNSLPYDSFMEQHFYFQKDLALASVYHAMNERSLMEAYAESARLKLEKKVRENSGDPRFHAALGLTYAYLGRRDEAVREGKRAVELLPISKDGCSGPPYLLNLARVYTIVGDFTNAVDRLEYFLSIPIGEFLWELASVPLLRIDPTWAPLRQQARFNRLLQESPQVGSE